MNIDLPWLEDEKEKVSTEINNMIIGKINKLKKKYPQCSENLDFTWEHKLCNSCFCQNRGYDDYDNGYYY